MSKKPADTDQNNKFGDRRNGVGSEKAASATKATKTEAAKKEVKKASLGNQLRGLTVLKILFLGNS
jgi:hypothetical protein